MGSAQTTIEYFGNSAPDEEDARSDRQREVRSHKQSRKSTIALSFLRLLACDYRRMKALEQTWRKLEARTAAHCKFLADAASCPDGLTARHALPEGVRCYDVLEQLLTKRQGVANKDKQEGRLGWAARVQSPAYKELIPEYRPFAFLQLPVDADPAELLGLDLEEAGNFTSFLRSLVIGGSILRGCLWF